MTGNTDETGHVPLDALRAGLPAVLQAPADGGELRLIVARPSGNARRVLEEGLLDMAGGLVGDTWKSRSSSRTPDGSAHPDAQITLVNTRAISLLAGEESRWALAGDQLYVDMDLGVDNLPPGIRLTIGEALLEVTSLPHLGCRKFADRFGRAALRFVNTETGRKHRLRGMYARVVRSGRIRRGDSVTKS